MAAISTCAAGPIPPTYKPAWPHTAGQDVMSGSQQTPRSLSRHSVKSIANDRA